MTDSMDPAKLEIVIALFEREYPEERIKKAIRHCNSVDSAIEWLERESGGGPAVVAAPGTPMDHATSTSAPNRAAKESRRRMNRKSAESGATTTRPLLEEQAAMPPSDSKASSHASPLSGNPQLTQSRSPAAGLEAQSIVASATSEPQAAGSAGLEECQAVAVLGEEIPLLEIHPMQPEVAADWWAQARARWPQIRQDLLDTAAGVQKRPASRDTVEAAATPNKKPRAGFESPTATAHARPPATPQGSNGSASASAANAAGEGEEAAGSSEEASATKPASPLSAPLGQFASRSAPALRSPIPSGKVSGRRGSWTPGTSPRAQMNHNPNPEMCEICCDDIDRGQAVRLGCRHGWYCFNCMQRHAEARLEVGAAHVACPECSAPIAECNLRKMLSPEIIERLLSRSLEQAVSCTSDLMACPTPNCPMRVALEDGEEPRLQCTACNKESCLRCGSQPYHKGITCEEHAERMRSRGRKKADVRDREAEDSFKQWMQETGTKQCPTCQIAVTKQNLEGQATQYQECHKMACRNCNTRFCFKCLKVLTDTFTCGCSIDRHGFVDPLTGKRLNHLKPVVRGRPAAKPVSKNKAGR